MIKFIVPRLDDKVYEEYLLPSLKKMQAQVFQVKDEPGKKESIFTKYNAGVEAVLKNGLAPEDIIVFVHEDVKLIDVLFQQKIEMLFNEKKDIGLVGIAGTTEFTDRGGWWMNTPDKLRGHLIQEMEAGQETHLVKGTLGYYDDLVIVDGCILMTTGKHILEGIRFDQETYDGNDFYDVDFCFEFLKRGYKVAVADILIHHKSQGKGSLEKPWHDAKEKFVEKWKDYTLPITISQFDITEDTIMEIEI